MDTTAQAPTIAMHVDGFVRPMQKSIIRCVRMIVKKNGIPLSIVVDSAAPVVDVSLETEQRLTMLVGDAQKLLDRTNAEYAARVVTLPYDAPGGPFGNDVKNLEEHLVMFLAMRHRDGHEWLIAKFIGRENAPRDLAAHVCQAMATVGEGRDETEPDPAMHQVVGRTAELIAAGIEYGSGLSTLCAH